MSSLIVPGRKVLTWANVQCNYAMLLQGVRRDYKRAWHLLQRALLLSPGFPPALSAGALLMHTSFDQPASALHMYQVRSFYHVSGRLSLSRAPPLCTAAPPRRTAVRQAVG